MNFFVALKILMQVLELSAEKDESVTVTGVTSAEVTSSRRLRRHLLTSYKNTIDFTFTVSTHLHLSEIDHSGQSSRAHEMKSFCVFCGHYFVRSETIRL